MSKKVTMLMILDGFGINEQTEGNSVKLANTPHLDEILKKPKTLEIKNNFEKSIITCKLCKTCGFLKRLESKRK